jgi:hypothetical protein
MMKPMGQLELGTLEDGSIFTARPEVIVTGRSCVVGASGSGKSYAVGVICEALCSAGIPFLVVDTEGEYSGLKEKFEVILVSDEDGCDLKWDTFDPSSLASTILEGPPLILDMSGIDKPKERVNELLTKLYEVISENRRPYLVILEEADRFIPQAGERVPIFGEIARRGRKRGLGLMVCTQRPSLVDKNILSQCSNQLIGKLVINNDLESVSQFFSNRNMLKQLTKLSPGQFFALGGFSPVPQIILTKKRITRHGGITPDFSSTVSGATKQSLQKVLSAIHSASSIPTKQTVNETNTQFQLGYEPLVPSNGIPLLVKRRKSHKIFGQGENLVSVQLEFKPIIEVALQTRKKGLISKKYVTGTFLVDGLSGKFARMGEGLEFHEGFERFLGLKSLDMEILKQLDTSKETSLLDLASKVNVSDDLARKSLNLLEKKRLAKSTKYGRSKLYRRIIELPQLEVNRDGTFLDVSEINISKDAKVSEPSMKEQDLVELIKGLQPDTEIEKFRTIYYPTYTAQLSLGGRLRLVHVDGRSGKVF